MSDCIILERVWPPEPGTSHIGGSPNLPAEIEWPRIQFADNSTAALDFLAQIDLQSLPNVYERGLLPERGTLYFFALSQSHVPLAELGPQSWRVLYSPSSAADIPVRETPADAGWNLDELYHAKTVAAEYRRPDGPRSALHPFCPVRARRVETLDGEVLGEKLAKSTFRYPANELPFRVEDGLLKLYFARNSWFENIIPFGVLMAHFKAEAVSYSEFAKTRSTASKASLWGRLLTNLVSLLSRSWLRHRGTSKAPPWHEYLMSRRRAAKFNTLYQDWREQTRQFCEELMSLGRSTVLSAEQRMKIAALYAEASDLKKLISPYALLGIYLPDRLAAMSLTELLLIEPQLALRYADEVAAADPAASLPHRMLGPGRDVQGGTMGNSDTFTLLQLESDPGPRFQWWDMGNLTFWITVKDAAAGRFDLAQAEIEGH